MLNIIPSPIRLEQQYRFKICKDSFDAFKMNYNIEHELLHILVCIISISFLCDAEGYIIDTINGNDNNSGETINDPFKTIAKCVNTLTNPGDECLIRAGYYHEVVNISGLKGELIIFVCVKLILLLSCEASKPKSMDDKCLRRGSWRRIGRSDNCLTITS